MMVNTTYRKKQSDSRQKSQAVAVAAHKKGKALPFFYPQAHPGLFCRPAQLPVLAFCHPGLKASLAVFYLPQGDIRPGRQIHKFFRIAAHTDKQHIAGHPSEKTQQHGLFCMIPPGNASEIIFSFYVK